MQDFKNISVWEKSHKLTVEIYKITASFPGSELYGLTSQIRRAAVSIPANIAEGCGRDGDVEFGRFLQIAQGSAYELEYHLLLAHELNFLNDKEHENFTVQVNEVRKMLAALIKKLKSDNQKLKAKSS
jgi:four helix bundle protein